MMSACRARRAAPERGQAAGMAPQLDGASHQDPAPLGGGRRQRPASEARDPSSWSPAWRFRRNTV